MVENYQVVSSVRGPRKANFSLGLYITIIESRILRNEKYGSFHAHCTVGSSLSQSLVTGSRALTPPSPSPAVRSGLGEISLGSGTPSWPRSNGGQIQPRLAARTFCNLALFYKDLYIQAFF